MLMNQSTAVAEWLLLLLRIRFNFNIHLKGLQDRTARHAGLITAHTAYPVLLRTHLNDLPEHELPAP
jgi:hypothetical protein